MPVLPPLLHVTPESGKLVGRLFARIHELVEDGDALVFVLIDEVRVAGWKLGKILLG